MQDSIFINNPGLQIQNKFKSKVKPRAEKKPIRRCANCKIKDKIKKEKKKGKASKSKPEKQNVTGKRLVKPDRAH